MVNKENPDATGTTIAGSGIATSETVQIDNRMRFDDGRIYITRTPFERGMQSGFPERVDVTGLVARAIAPFIAPPQERE